MNPLDRKRAKLYAIGEEIREGHKSGACGRRGCKCLARYERTRKRYLALIDDGDDSPRAGNSRRAGRR